MILDIHTHSLSPDPQAVIDLSSLLRDTQGDFSIPSQYSADQLFSIGIHPWTLTEELPDGLLDRLERAAQLPQVAIIGEVGIDIPKGGPLFRQMTVFKKLIEISERVKKPLLIHDVKAHEVIIGLHKEMKPRRPWIIHGFRSKPTVADMFIREGMYLSFGEQFNPLTLHNVPADRILSETDDSPLPISEIIHQISDTRGTDTTHLIEENTRRILEMHH